MEEYKQINKQLIKQIQEMRLREASYRTDVAELCKQLLEERQLRVEIKAKLEETITNNFRVTLREINPDSQVLKILLSENCVSEDCGATGSGGDGQTTESNQHVNMQRRCSSNGMQRRYTTVIKSPIPRRSSGQNGSANPTELANIRNVSAYRELHESTIDNSQIIIEEVTEQEAHSSRDLNENDEEEDNTDDSEEEVSAFNVEDDEQSDENENAANSINVSTSAESQVATPNLDIISEEDEEIVIVKKPRTRARQRLEDTLSPLQDVTNKKKTPTAVITAELKMKESNVLAEAAKIPQIILHRVERLRHSENNDSIELPRLLSEPANNTGGKENNFTIDSASFALNESTMRTIGNAPCSTPRNLRLACVSNEATLQTQARETISIAIDETTNVNRSGRPSRRCKPTSLMEQNCKQKLRSDSGEVLRKRKTHKK